MPLARISGFMILLAVVSTVKGEETPVDYATQVKPILGRHCAGCHGAKKQQVGLRVDTGRGLLEGGDSGPAVIPGDSAKSLLIHALTGSEGASQMPPEGDKLSEADISVIRRWIDQGAKSPADEVAEAADAKSSDHWAFKPIRSIPAPILEMPGTPRNEIDPHGLKPMLRNGKLEIPGTPQNEIDGFILARLENQGLSPSPAAEATTLVRRLHLDLLGVPPSVETIHEYLADRSPDAYERLIDRLLASPHYGERWGRDWLDSARYADSNGFTRDQPRSIWKYRDWVINACNENMPFDQFAIEQIAGDLLPNPTLEQLIATGFHRNTLINEEGGTDPEQFRVESVVDRVNTTGTVFLGLTIGCAQCHDHKYDPISQREYYQFYAFFNSTEFHPGDPAAPRIDVPSIDEIHRREPERKSQIRDEIHRLEKELHVQSASIAADLVEWEKALSEDEKKKLPFNIKNAVDLPLSDRSEVHKRDLDGYFRGLKIARDKYTQLNEIARLKDSEPKFPTTTATREIDKPRPSFIHIRGDFLRHGANVEPAVPVVLASTASQSDRDVKTVATGSRLSLAKWLVSSDNVLTPRVIANRYWQRFFGRGLVETENDFGTKGDRPTHPELLDWIANEFRGTGRQCAASCCLMDEAEPATPAPNPQSWNVKRLHRLFVTTATYRQASHSRPDLTEVDPLNKLLARQSRLRVDAEVVRDMALTVSGLLDEELGGPPVYPPQPEGVFDFTQDKKPWKTSMARDRHRKALYTHLWRSSLYPAMAVFDFPDPNVACTRRIRSNTPLQSLTLANDETFFEFARGFACRLLEATANDDSQRLSAAVETTLGREPTSSELARLRGYLQQQRERFSNDPAAADAFAPKPVPDGTTASEAAAWAAVSRVLMNLDEFITRE